MSAPDALEARAEVCRAVSLLFLHELDRDTLARAAPLLEELLGAEACAEAAGDLEALAADYAHTLLLGMPAFGSHYLDPSGLLNAESTGQVALAYREQGFVVDITRAPAEDHIGVEIEFVARLLAAEADARRRAAREEAIELRRRRAGFLEQHLLPFALLFLPAAASTARTAFYRALCRAAQELLLDLAG